MKLVKVGNPLTNFIFALFRGTAEQLQSRLIRHKW